MLSTPSQNKRYILYRHVAKPWFWNQLYSTYNSTCIWIQASGCYSRLVNRSRSLEVFCWLHAKSPLSTSTVLTVVDFFSKSTAVENVLHLQLCRVHYTACNIVKHLVMEILLTTLLKYSASYVLAFWWISFTFSAGLGYPVSVDAMLGGAICWWASVFSYGEFWKSNIKIKIKKISTKMKMS